MLRGYPSRPSAALRVALAMCAICTLLGLAGSSRAENAVRVAPAEAARISKMPAPLPEGAVKLAAPVATPPVAGAKGGTDRKPVVRPPVTSKTVRIPIAVEGKGQTLSSALRITSGAGSIIPDAHGDPVLEAAPNSRIVLSSDPGKASAAGNELREDAKTPLPWIVVETNSADAGSEVRTSRPFLTVQRAITWDTAQKKHVASFLFGLDAETGSPGPLDPPLEARFAVTCEMVEPATAEVTKVGPAGYQTVTVSCSQGVKNERKGQELQVFVDRGNLTYPFNIPRRAGPPALGVDQKTPYGFGFGSPELIVRSVEEDGTPLLADGDVQVHFTFEGGNVETSGVTIAKGAEDASLQIHPRGVGDVRVTAIAREMRSNVVTIRLGWPIVPIVAIVAGGSIGGLATTFRKKADRRKLNRALLQGCIIGILVTALALILPGVVEVPSFLLQTEIGLFAIAAFAAYGGTPLLDKLTSLVFPKLSGEKA
jgi:hypothetical protein